MNIFSVNLSSFSVVYLRIEEEKKNNHNTSEGKCTEEIPLALKGRKRRTYAPLSGLRKYFKKRKERPFFSKHL